jgi:hypothetical protein
MILPWITLATASEFPKVGHTEQLDKMARKLDEILRRLDEILGKLSE